VSEADLGLSLTTTWPPDKSKEEPELDAIDEEFINNSQAAVKSYLDGMPNYIADETANRYGALSIPPQWRKVDQVRCEVRFDGNNETRENILLNDRSWPQPFATLPGSKWRGGFGGRLRALFDPRSMTA
jgi:hypothetical protein